MHTTIEHASDRAGPPLQSRPIAPRTPLFACRPGMLGLRLVGVAAEFSLPSFGGVLLLVLRGPGALRTDHAHPCPKPRPPPPSVDRCRGDPSSIDGTSCPRAWCGRWGAPQPLCGLMKRRDRRKVREKGPPPLNTYRASLRLPVRTRKWVHPNADARPIQFHYRFTDGRRRSGWASGGVWRFGGRLGGGGPKGQGRGERALTPRTGNSNSHAGPLLDLGTHGADPHAIFCVGLVGSNAGAWRGAAAGWGCGRWWDLGA